MNKKAFTLVELVVILVIIGVIVIFALPNVTSTLERNKKDQMIIDAKDMVDKAKNYILKTSSYTDGVSLSLDAIDSRKEIIDSPFGNSYDREYSCVKRTRNGNQYQYKICLHDDQYKLEVDDISDLLLPEKYTKIKRDNNDCSCD